MDNTTPVFSIYPSASPCNFELSLKKKTNFFLYLTVKNFYCVSLLVVTAVSGTTIVGSADSKSLSDPPICGGDYPCTHGTQEVPCTVANTYYQWTTGGGFSNYGARPSYQSDVVAAYLSSNALIPPTKFFPSNMRGYADVSVKSKKNFFFTNSK